MTMPIAKLSAPKKAILAASDNIINRLPTSLGRCMVNEERATATKVPKSATMYSVRFPVVCSHGKPTFACKVQVPKSGKVKVKGCKLLE